MTAATTVNDLHFAVVVGIDRYPALSDLKGARRDAVSFRQWLAAPNGGGLPERNIRMVEASPMETPLSEVLPTQRQFDNAMSVVHREVRAATDADADAWARTRLYVFVAGHGIKSRDSSGGLLMADATWDLLGLNIDLAKYVSWHETNALFSEVFVFADCCRVARDVSYSCKPTFTDNPTGKRTTAVLAYATTADRAALASPSNEGRGVFTDALLAALNGAAANRNGEVTLQRVEQLVNERLGGRQVSEFIPTRSAAVVVRVPPPGEREVRFHLSEPFYGVVELSDGTSVPEQLFLAGAELRQRLKPGLYELKAVGPNAPVFRNRGMVRVDPGSEPFDVTL